MNEQTIPTRNLTLEDFVKLANSSSLRNEIIAFEREETPEIQFKSPFRVDGLIIFLILEGSGKIGIDLKTYEVKPNSLIVIQPQNFIKVVEVYEHVKCNIIACSRRVISEMLPKLTDLLPLIIYNRSAPVTYLNSAECNTINFYYKLVRTKLSEGATSPYTGQKVLCILQAALFELLDIHHRRMNFEHQTSKHSRAEEIMAKFILMVSENFRTHRQVSYYAERLCITPKHLSTVVKEISGRTAGDWIENFVIMEAKVLLRNTDMTIQEISSRLNFANQSFFGKYFRYQTGLSPTQFRRTDR